MSHKWSNQDRFYMKENEIRGMDNWKGQFDNYHLNSFMWKLHSELIKHLLNLIDANKHLVLDI